MSYAHTLRRFDLHITIDVQAMVLAALLVGVSVATIELVPWLMQPEIGVEKSTHLSGRSATEQAAAGGGLAIAEAAYAAVVLSVIWLMRYVPEFYRTLLKRNLLYGFLLWFGLSIGLGAPEGASMPYLGIATILAAYSTLKLIDHAGLWWIVNNIGALALAVVGAAVLGILVGVWFTLVFLVGMSIYDHYFANKKSWMIQLAKPIVRYRVPVLVVRPSKWRFEWGELLEMAGEDEDGEGDQDEPEQPENNAWAIGTGDLLLPGILVAALVAYWGGPVIAGAPLPAWGVIGGLVLAAARIRWSMINREEFGDERDEGAAGLPPITTGAIAGFAVMAAIGVIV